MQITETNVTFLFVTDQRRKRVKAIEWETVRVGFAKNEGMLREAQGAGIDARADILLYEEGTHTRTQVM